MSDSTLLKLRERMVRDNTARMERISAALAAGVVEFATVSGTEAITIEPSPERPGEHRVTRWGARGMIVRVDSPDALAMLFEMGASKPAKPGVAGKFMSAQIEAVEGQE